MKSALQSSTVELLLPLLHSEGIELVDVEYDEAQRPKVIRILIHKPGGVSAEDCRHVSEIVSPALDIYEDIQGSYLLEVASPGVDRPLRTEADFRRNIGRTVNLEFSESAGKTVQVQGALEAVDNGQILLSQISGKMIKVSISKLFKAQIQLMW